MKQMLSLLLAGLMLFGITGCAAGDSRSAEQDRSPASQSVVTPTQAPVAGFTPSGPQKSEPEADIADIKEASEMDQNTFYVTLAEETFAATFAQTSGATALKTLLAEGPLALSLRDYGGFEKVGPLGQRLPASDAQTTTQSGDIVLYQGNQIVLFYGSNSWSYTRLGRIDDLTGWAEALGHGDILVTLSLQAP